MPRRPKFLARRSYRRRRMFDAARLLPILGLFLVLLPILWMPAWTPEPDTARGAIYLFSVWLFLVVIAFVLSRLLMQEPRPDDLDGQGSGDPDAGEGPL